jgi:hypothetical protein
MTDGSSLGIDAKRALRANLSGEQPTEDEKQTPEQVAARLDALDPEAWRARAEMLAAEGFEHSWGPDAETFTSHEVDSAYYKLLDAEFGDESAYARVCDLIAKRVLDWLRAHPDRHDAPADSEVDWPNGYNGDAVVTRWGVYDLMKADGIELSGYGMTGFQWGFAVNLARYALGLPEVANPALIDVHLADDTDG